jgi:hypothetical protein
MVAGDTLVPQQGFRDILYPPHRHSGQIHLNQRFFHAAFSAAISLNDGRLKGHSFELRYF